MKQKILIIGSGIAGLSAASAARKQDPTADITILTRDTDPAFYRLRLGELIGKKTPLDSFYIHPVSWYSDNKISLLLDHTVSSVDYDARTVTTDKGVFSFDSLIISSGSYPFIPPFGGKDLQGIHTFWNLRDIPRINEDLKNSRNAVVIGGGLLGLEVAYRIRKMGIHTTLVEGLPHLLGKQLDEEGSDIFSKKVLEVGVSILCGQSVREFQGGTRVEKVALTDGSVLDADIVIVSVGVRPNLDIIGSGRILTERYITVNEKMQVRLDSQTKGVPEFSDFVYAAGDVACFENKWFGQWTVSMMQGQIAGSNAAGGNAVFQIKNSPYILNTMETKVSVSGEGILSDGEGIEVLRVIAPETFSYMKLVFRNNILIGGILIGEYSSKFVTLQALLKNKATKEAILLSDFFPQWPSNAALFS